MPDREKVIEGLEKLRKDLGYGLPDRSNVVMEYLNSLTDAIALLKEQEAVEPIPPTDESDLWKCGYCHHQLIRCTHQRYCEMCGREVKWE